MAHGDGSRAGGRFGGLSGVGYTDSYRMVGDGCVMGGGFQINRGYQGPQIAGEPCRCIDRDRQIRGS